MDKILLPEAEIYEMEYRYFPWGETIDEVLKFVVRMAPKNGSVLDLMCGTGNLLGRIRRIRDDLELIGVDEREEYINFARKNFEGIEFICQDVFAWQPGKQYSLITCTGGLHHAYNKKDFLKLIYAWLFPGGEAIVADPYIADYKGERERRLAALELGCEYARATVGRNAPNKMVGVALDIIRNDINLTEYKTSIKKIIPVFKEVFMIVGKMKVWPTHSSDYGDYIFLLRK